MSQSEDLREFYITPDYLSVMTRRIKSWNKESILGQLHLFRKTIPDYPEVMDILEAELHKRDLNKLVRYIKKKPVSELQSLLKKYKNTPDFKEVIDTELEIRSGVPRLFETQAARLVLESV